MMNQSRAALAVIDMLIPLAMIANEIGRGSKVLVLSPIEDISKEKQTAGLGYIDKMKQNFANLSENLECR
jgi:ABC-type Zn uptake system ZnuABC Zn-binding protein ZnuA